MRFYVQVGFEDGRYYVLNSDIAGLNIETNTFEDFCEVAADVTRDLLDDTQMPVTIKFHHEKTLSAA